MRLELTRAPTVLVQEHVTTFHMPLVHRFEKLPRDILGLPAIELGESNDAFRSDAGNPEAIVRHSSLRSTSSFDFAKDRLQDNELPTLRFARIIELIWEKRPEVRCQVRRPAFHLGAGRTEVDEP